MLLDDGSIWLSIDNIGDGGVVVVVVDVKREMCIRVS